jgi:hypothetical protein
MVRGRVGKQFSIHHFVQEAILVMKSCDGSTMRSGSENDFRKAAVSVNAFFRKMNGKKERPGLKGIPADKESQGFSLCSRESHKRARDDGMSCQTALPCHSEKKSVRKLLRWLVHTLDF